MIRALILDFDGTLVTHDILDVVCDIVGKAEESRRINEEFHAGTRSGLSPLVTRINFLKGVSLRQIQEKLNEEAYLMPGARELLDYANAHGMISILNSGNIMPVLDAYRQMLSISYVVGTHPQMDGDRIVGISVDDIPSGDFKLKGVQEILSSLSIDPHDVVAIGDSPADRNIFDMAGYSIAINPKGDVEQYANAVILGDLLGAIPIIEQLRSTGV